MAQHVRDIKEPTPQYTSSGEEHGLVKVLPNSVPDNEFKRFKEKDRPAMMSNWKEEGRMVSVTYINRLHPGERLEATYCKWDGDPLLQYKLIPDQTYSIPKGFVDQVNNKKRMKRTGLLDKSGKELMVDANEPIEHMFVSAAAI